jgi:hypothetical protein
MFPTRLRNRDGNFGFRRFDLTFRRVPTAAFVDDEEWYGGSNSAGRHLTNSVA